MNRSKAKGTAWETAIVGTLNDAGFGSVERRTLAGVNDKGDIAGLNGIVIEAKNCATEAMPQWLREAEAERINAKGWLGVVWSKVRGKASPLDGRVTMSGAQWVVVLKVLQKAGVGL